MCDSGLAATAEMRRKAEKGLRRGCLAAGQFALALALGLASARAQTPQPPPAKTDARQDELKTIENQLEGSQQQQRRLQTDLEAMRAEHVRLTAALLSTTAKTRADEEQTRDVQQRLETAVSSEDAIRRSLERRRGLIALVLAALQRMGRKPPPAVLVDPSDMLAAIRTSMLLGSVLPQMRQEIDSLSADLADLARARASVSKEKADLASDLAALTTQRKKLADEIDARQAAQSQEQKALDAETARARELALKASSLRDLISRVEREPPLQEKWRAGGAVASWAKLARAGEAFCSEARNPGPPGIRLGNQDLRDPGRIRRL